MESWDLINQKIEENKEEMLQMLQALIAIPSVCSPPEGDKPFGSSVHEAFCYMLDKGSKEGFVTKNVDNYGGHIDMPGEGDADGDGNGNGNGQSKGIMGILGHLDVVPEGADWVHEPFGGVIEDGTIFGRGTIDDKGPLVACFYAMKAIKDAGVKPAHTIRLILGLDEEAGMLGMDHYLSKVGEPDFGFTPDGDFPVIHGEKGVLIFDIAKKLTKTVGKGLELRTLKGGNAPNMVADFARAILRDENTERYEIIKAAVAKFRQEAGAKINCKGIGKTLEITVQGVSSHGAKPELGVNAISIMMDFLGRLSFVNDDVTDFINFYNSHIGYELDGQSLGCGFSDEPSGKLVFNVGKINMDSRAAGLTVNIRYPVTQTDDAIYDAIMPVMHRYNLGIVKEKHFPPLYIPAEDPMIQTLMDIYQTHTGDKESKALVIGGGTYARATKNTVAFGARFPEEPDKAHQKEECLSIDSLVKMTKIYADAICRLGKP